MNDNYKFNDDLPEWVWEIADKYGLGVRADRPVGGVLVLLRDAVFNLQEVAAATIRDEAVTPGTKQRLRKAIDMLTGRRASVRSLQRVGRLRHRYVASV